MSTSLVAEQARVDALADELEKAHGIIRIMLNCLAGDAKRDMVYRIIAAGLDGEGVTRANEREQLLAQVAIVRSARALAVPSYPQAQVVAAASLADRSRMPILAQDLGALALAIGDLLDAGEALASGTPTPADVVRFRAQLKRFGAEHRTAPIPPREPAAIGG